MTEQTDLWQGPFGDFYQERNKLNDKEVQRRVIFLEGILKVIYGHTGAVPKSIYELGAGQGPNMRAFEILGPKYNQALSLYATEINQKARLALTENCKTVDVIDLPTSPVADLVMTYGVLIHVHPAHLKHVMEHLYTASNRWILCVEYFAPETRPIPYRGEKSALWLDDYGSKWLEACPNMMVLGYGFMWKKTTGLDNVTFWLFEKKKDK